MICSAFSLIIENIEFCLLFFKKNVAVMKRWQLMLNVPLS